jgi:hypothetical protein
VLELLPDVLLKIFKLGIPAPPEIDQVHPLLAEKIRVIVRLPPDEK